jgi:PAS domain S-box-containing protein
LPNHPEVSALPESAAVPLVVVCSARDPVEALNSLLRRQGIAAHCTWIAALKDLPEALEQAGPEMLLCLPGEHLSIAEVVAVRDSARIRVPVLSVRSGITEELMAADLAAGARDTINLTQPQRAHQVIARELHAWRLQRAYDEAQQAVQESRKQLDSVLTRSNDAIIDVQEGILVEANQSWLELTGVTDPDAVVGQPVMDVFHRDSHVALKGALTACLRGQWKDHALKASARMAAGGTVPVELLLTLGERDGEPCVRIMVPIKKIGAAQPGTVPVPVIAAPRASPVAAGTAPAAVKPVPASTPVAVPTAVPVVVPPAVPVALPVAAPVAASLAEAATEAEPQTREAVTDGRVREYDSIWVKHIQAALMENRFRLVQQPITNLGGGPPMFDLLIRMVDRSRKEIMPREFLPAAERNQLLAPIDRWVISAAARFAAESKADCLFVRLSRQSAVDETLPRWLMAQLSAVGIEPKQLCLTVTEAVAVAHVQQVRRQAQAIKSLGIRFALEHFGIGPDPLALLGGMPMNFIKIDGGLIQGVKDDELVQSKIEALVEAARERNIDTIAANVEDANTMAVLWQLGVQHLEGFLIPAPEEVVMVGR